MSTIEWSGAEGLAQVPFRRFFRPIRREVPENAAIVTAYTDGQVTLRANRSKIGYHEAASLEGYQGVEPGDFVVHGLDIMRGSVGISDSSGAISSVCTICAPLRNLDLRYVAYLIREQAFSGFPKALARGVRDGGADFRRWDTLAELPIPVIEVETQRAIADFLDRETAEIDEFVAESEKLITLLNERRAAVITQAVTKGFPSRSVGQVSRITLGKMVNSKPEGDATNLAPYLRAAHVQPNGRLIDLDEQMMHFSARELRQLSLRAGDVVVVEGGAGFGRSALVRQDLEGHGFQNSIVRLRPISCLVLGSYLDYAIQSALTLGEIESLVSTSTIPHFTAEKVARLRIEIPPFEVQESLVASVDDQTAKIDEAIETAREAIALAKERRQALISAAVTGKIDVRAAA